MKSKLLECMQRIKNEDTTLTVIDLSGQGISNVQVVLLFRNLSQSSVVANQIRVIILSNNNITCLPLMPNLPRLTRIFLDHNRLNIPPDMHGSSIELVDLSYNFLESPPNISKLVKLNYLDLRDNPMHVLPDMSRSTQLSQLRLDRVPLAYLDYVSLKKLARNGCEISLLENLSIDCLISLDGPHVPLQNVFADYMHRLKDSLEKTLLTEEFIYKCVVLFKCLGSVELVCKVLECFDDTPSNYLKAFMEKIKQMLPDNPMLAPYYNSYEQSIEYKEESRLFSTSLVATAKKTLSIGESTGISTKKRPQKRLKMGI